MLTLTESELDRDSSLQSEEESSWERRRGLRIRQDRPIKVYEPMSSRYIPGQTRDISATGLRIELSASAAVRAGRIVNVHVGLNGDGAALVNRRHMIPAKVVWVDRSIGRQGRITAGIEFVASVAAHLDAA